MKVIGIIPARYGSTRFPGKPLTMIQGKPMIQHVYEHAAQAMEEVWVATDDERILDAVGAFGGCATMTSPDCKNGTERCAEVAKLFWELEEEDIIVNIQGDMPFITPQHIKVLLHAHTRDPHDVITRDITTLYCELLLTDRINPNCVKAYVAPYGWIKHFDRYVHYHPGLRLGKHIGLYAYKKEVLLSIAQLEETEDEQELRLEQLRWMRKYNIMGVFVEKDVISIDTPEDLKKL